MKAPVSRNLRQAIGVVTTGAAVVVAVFGARALWIHYQVDPWTRDGRVRAEVMQIAPDVQGLVTKVYFGNDQMVHKGDVLFEIDRPRYEIALQQAETAVSKAEAAVVRAQAAVVRAQATLAEARREAVRNHGLGELIATETTEQSQTKVSEGEAALAEARAAVTEAQVNVAEAKNARDLAALNLTRTRVIAPLDGRLSDLGLRPGNYVSPGKAVVALVDTASLRIEGYFEETKLGRVHIGQKATVRMMGESRTISGHVTSIAQAIEDHDRTASANGLPAINPNFSWVRLAQRVPVRIALDNPPADLALIPGRTATVTLDQADGKDQRK